MFAASRSVSPPPWGSQLDCQTATIASIRLLFHAIAPC